MSETVRAVLFDFYGTLARAVAWGPLIEDVLSHWGLRLDEGARALAEAADGEEHLEHSVDRDAYVAWERARIARFVGACGAAAADVEAIAADLYAAVKHYHLEAYDEVPGVLGELAGAGITVAVCSNWDWDLDRALDQAGLSDLIEVAVTSAQAGARKPHPRIYRHTLAACGGIDPGEALFVGDSWGPDVEGPRQAGIRPVHVWRGEDGRDPPSAGNVPRISDLRPLADLVATRRLA